MCPLGKLPLLLVGDVPELDSIFGTEVGLADFAGMEVPLADDLRLVYRLGPNGEGEHVVGMEVQKEVGQQAVVINMALVFGGKSRQTATLGLAIHGHRLDAVAKVHASTQVCRLG